MTGLRALVLTLGALSIASVAGAQETKVTYPRDVITRMEIDERALDAKNAEDVIRRLRPHFMRRRSTGAIAPPVKEDNSRNQAAVRTEVQVYLNGTRQRGPEVLSGISRDAIIEIVYLDASDATTRFGTGNESGAIIVRTGPR
jgi:hypothetical protein